MMQRMHLIKSTRVHDLKKNLGKVGKEGHFLNLIKCICLIKKVSKHCAQ